MEIVGELTGKHNDTDVWKYFDQLGGICFLTCPLVPSLLIMWKVRQEIQQRLIQLMHADNANIHLIDGFPIDVCLRTRARNSKIFKGEAAHGYCASKDKYFYGFQGHLFISRSPWYSSWFHINSCQY